MHSDCGFLLKQHTTTERLSGIELTKGCLLPYSMRSIRTSVGQGIAPVSPSLHMSCAGHTYAIIGFYIDTLSILSDDKVWQSEYAWL